MAHFTVNFLVITLSAADERIDCENYMLAFDLLSENGEVTTQHYRARTPKEAITLVERIRPTHLYMDAKEMMKTETYLHYFAVARNICNEPLPVLLPSLSNYIFTEEESTWLESHLLKYDVLVSEATRKELAVDVHRSIEIQTSAMIRSYSAGRSPLEYQYDDTVREMLRPDRSVVWYQRTDEANRAGRRLSPDDLSVSIRPKKTVETPQ